MARLVTAYPTHLRGVREHMIDKLERQDLAGVADSMGKLTDPTACQESENADTIAS
jgi:hypothetical protein